MLDPIDVEGLANEVADGNFNDARLSARLKRLVHSVAREPQASFPDLFGTSDLEAAYRFFSNVFVTLPQIVQPHIDATAARVGEESCVRVLHDTTEFAYRRDGRRRGFDDERGYQSFCGHFSLAVSADRARKPLGVAAVRTWPKGTTQQSLWMQQVLASEAALGCAGESKAVHVCDRGADDYAFLCDLLENGSRFVVRSGVDRNALNEGANEKMRTVLARVEHAEERSAFINRRRRESSQHRAKIHPQREPRVVHLYLSAATIELVRPRGAPKKKSAELASKPQTLQVNVVRVWEPEPPEGASPVEWYLLTSESIATPADVEAVVDHYRARWVIEEYFKALKTGCSFELRQLQDYESLLNALGLFIPVAYHMLLLRTIARTTPDAPASAVASDDQIAVLRSPLARRKLADQPTARDILLAIAALGGHIKYAPDPGWLTIARGYEKLDTYVAAWRVAAKLPPHSDQR